MKSSRFISKFYINLKLRHEQLLKQLELEEQISNRTSQKLANISAQMDTEQDEDYKERQKEKEKRFNEIRVMKKTQIFPGPGKTPYIKLIKYNNRSV